MPLRVLDAAGSGSTANSAAAFAYAGDHGVRVVNASIGSTGFSNAEYSAISSHPNTLYVVAAGNGGPDQVGDDNDVTPTFPCAYDLANVLCVGATDSSDDPAVFSNYGATSVDLSAPGVTILSTYPDDQYAFMDGTSMATPHVTGVAALLLARDPSLTTAQIKAAIMDGGDDDAALHGLTQTGRRLNAAGALARIPDTTPPAVPSSVTATPASGRVTLAWQADADEDLAGYRVYHVSDDPLAAPALIASPVAAAWVATGLADGTPVHYRVTAVDVDGNESAASTVVSATPRVTPAPAPAAPAPAPSAGPAPTTAAAGGTTPISVPAAGTTAAPTVGRIRVTGRAVVCSGTCHRRSATLQFTLGAEATVRVTVARKVCAHGGCRYRTAGTRRIRLAAGVQRVAVGPSLAGIAVRAGAYRVTLETTAGHARATFSVRSR
jgi:subtilisin family serine protease